MRKLTILLILSIITLNTFAQVEFPGGPGGELDVDIYPVKKQGFKSSPSGSAARMQYDLTTLESSSQTDET